MEASLGRSRPPGLQRAADARESKYWSTERNNKSSSTYELNLFSKNHFRHEPKINGFVVSYMHLERTQSKLQNTVEVRLLAVQTFSEKSLLWLQINLIPAAAAGY
jgi:hypothetical protein